MIFYKSIYVIDLLGTLSIMLKMPLPVALSSKYSLLLLANSLKQELLLLCIMDSISVHLWPPCSIFSFVTYPVSA